MVVKGQVHARNVGQVGGDVAVGHLDEVLASQRDMLRHLELTAEAQRSLASYCARAGIAFASSAFDEECYARDAMAEYWVWDTLGGQVRRPGIPIVLPSLILGKPQSTQR